MSTDALPQIDPALLPDDPAILKQLVVQLLEELRKANAHVERLEHQIHLLLKRIYGSSSEKLDPRQGVLFEGEAVPEGTAPSKAPPPPPAASTSKNRDRHGRGRIPDSIQREERVHDLTDAEKAALGGAENLVELPPERSEQLDWRPSTLVVIVHVRRKYARKDQLPESGLTLAEQNVVVASKPPEAIPGALAAPGLTAQVVVSKGVDHLPLHRLEGIFQRQGVRISRQTMDDWWLKSAEFLRPMYSLAGRVVLASHVVHTDDTPVKIRDAWRKLKHTGRFWPYVGDALHPLTVFDYTPTHQRDGPAAFLKDYRGYLQADAFNGYDGIYLESHGRIIEVGCWAHVRRKFHESRRLDPPRMETALAWIGKLYAVEKDLRERCQGQWQGLSLEECASRSRPSGRTARGRCWMASILGWKRKPRRCCPRVTSVGRWSTPSRTGRHSPFTRRTAGWTSTTTKARIPSAGCVLGAATGSSAGAIAVAGRRRSTSASWHPASATVTIPGSICVTCSLACQRSCPAPAKKSCCPCCPTSGSRPDDQAAAALVAAT